MKAKILITAGVASLAIVISVAIYAVNENRNNDLFWANVEALTSNEGVLEVDCASYSDSDCKKRFRLADGTVRIVKVPYAVQVTYAR